MKHQQLKFQIPSKEGFTSLPFFLKNGGILTGGEDLLLETRITDLTKARLIGWDKSKDENDPNNFGLYQTSIATVQLENGSHTEHPFSMTYIKIN